MGRHREDLTGKKFGRLTAIEPRKASNWLWRCDCGVEKELQAANVKRGNTSSCGCLNRELVAERSTTHGKCGTPVYSVWAGMFDRCNKHPRYHGRGITVCERWKKFENFYADMGDRPPGMSIDRIDNDKGYSPDNCRWATMREQSRNKGWNIWVEYQGRDWNLKDLADWSGVSYQTLYQRHKAGMTGNDLFRRRKKSSDTEQVLSNC